MLCTTFLALDPGLQASVQCLKAGSIGWCQADQELRTYGLKPSFNFTFSLWTIGSGVDERDTELGTDNSQMAGAVVGAIIHVKPGNTNISSSF